jgi:hypothetical protein
MVAKQTDGRIVLSEPMISSFAYLCCANRLATTLL